MTTTNITTNCLNLDSLDFRINRIMQKYPQILKILLILGILVQTIACDKVPDEDTDIGNTQQKAKYCGYGEDCPVEHCQQSPKICYGVSDADTECPEVIHSGLFGGTFASEKECKAAGFPISDMCITATDLVHCSDLPSSSSSSGTEGGAKWCYYWADCPKDVTCDQIPICYFIGYDATECPTWMSGQFTGPFADKGECIEPVNLSSSSSGSSGVIEGEPVTYQGQTYKTVQIGNQTWMAENLNYYASGSECYEILYNCPHGNEVCPALYSYCDSNKYGRLYDWATAMKIDSRFNNASYIAATATNCASDGSASTNCVPANPYHQGICPAGWHIPSKAEWEELFDYVASILNPYYREAGVQLKAKEGWNEWQWCPPCPVEDPPVACAPCAPPPPYRGEDTYGFKALPGGIWATSYGDALVVGFFDIGEHGYWWSTTEDTETTAANSKMSYNSGKADFGFAGSPSSGKNSKMSVRCVSDIKAMVDR